MLKEILFFKMNENQFMVKWIVKINFNFGERDKICYPEVSDFSVCRKPKLGINFNVKSNFPDIKLDKDIIVGDSISNIFLTRDNG